MHLHEIPGTFCSLECTCTTSQPHLLHCSALARSPEHKVSPKCTCTNSQAHNLHWKTISTKSQAQSAHWNKPARNPKHKLTVKHVFRTISGSFAFRKWLCFDILRRYHIISTEMHLHEIPRTEVSLKCTCTTSQGLICTEMHKLESIWYSLTTTNVEMCKNEYKIGMNV